MCAAMLSMRAKLTRLMDTLVESALPEDLLRVWQRNSTSSGTTDAKDRLYGLMDFLQKEVIAEERIAMAVQGFEYKTFSKENKEMKRKQKLQSNEVASAAGLINAKPSQVIEYICCSEKHDSSLCNKAKTMSLEERQKISKESNETQNKVEDKIERQNLASLSKKPEVFLQTLQVCLINAVVELQPINETLCQDIPKKSGGPWIEELQHKSVTLSDYEYADNSISLLIGADIAGELYTGKIFNLKCKLTTIETRLGRTLLGRTPQFKKQESDTVLTVLSMYAQNADIDDLWNPDVIGIEDPILKLSKGHHLQEILFRFRDTIKINQSGRYEVFLPWKENHPPLCENREIAERRLRNTIVKLRNDGLLHEYEKVFNEWLEEGIIEEVPAEELSSPGHYLPHRHVVKENSTTRIRPIFDASATEKGKFSLNQCLEVGPNFIERVPTLLLRFREKRIGTIADIRRAFLQISITPKKRDYVRFFWQRTSDNKIVTYRHCRVVFGITSSPFLLGATLDYHLEQVLEKTIDEQEKSIIKKLRRSLYVDNCVTSVGTEEEISSFKAIAIYVMSTGGFDLRGWELTGESDPLHETTVLGMTGNKQEDVLTLPRTALQQETPSRITKREILSSTYRVYDALGFISPVTLYSKLLLRKLWEQNFDWDTEVELQIKEAFLLWLRELENLSQVKIPRWIFDTNESILSLHLFVNASQKAYAAVIFVRIETKNKVKVHFVQAKNRVAPKKMTTIPRLELLAALIETRLMRFTLTTLENSQIETFYWTDSTTVLAWIQRKTQWATFVWN
ncbi:PREDICTED: uncharacterized protein LOC108782470 [Cyphomyrmex costatus]|uniref:uncharacterized protein LOC108782470 n=1 Tax=Cyphomyrmex costatus TaxID=456900 RepID=UPI00085236CE|nr:PREDICTED: uncharacterized protein LOC108782470 [Cyphomyrmex costatus]